MDDVEENKGGLLSDEETPLTVIEEEIIPSTIPEIRIWTTSLLSEICREGDIQRLRVFIEFSRQNKFCGADATKKVDRLDVDTGLSPLHHAARYQQMNVCLLLLSNINFVHGVNTKDAHDRTPMHSAFRSLNNNNNSNIENQIQIETDFGNEFQDYEAWQKEYNTTLFSHDYPLIYLFAKANGNINAHDKYRLTPLHYAVAGNHLLGVKQLITLNADIESEDRQGIRPLHLACKEGYLSIVEYLINQGAKIDAIDDDYWTPIHHACAKGHLDIVKLINSIAKLLKMKTNMNATCLHLAVQNGNIGLVEYILTEFTNEEINQLAEPLGTPLHIAAKFCDPSMLHLLYQHGANPLILNSNEQSHLHIACASNRLSIVQEIYNLTQTSLLEIKDNHGRTALSVTTNSDIIDQLITFGADISSLDNNDMNAIMIAVSTGQLAIVNRLLSTINDQLLPILDQVENRNDYSIFLIAVQTGSVDMCSLLLSHSYIRWDTIDKQCMNAFHIAAKNNHYELIKFLCNYIDSDIDNNQQIRLYIDAQNEDGKTPLHFASEHGHILCIKSLLEYNADVLLANYLGQLPFHTAIQNGHCQCVELLIKVCRKNMNEFQSVLSRRPSPLITACQNGFADIVEILTSENIGVNYGIDFDSNKEENPLEIAIRYRQIQTIHVLLEHPHTEYWLMPIRNHHQSPLRDMIRYMPDCAQHAFDKMIYKKYDIDSYGEVFQRMTYKYEYIDDYFMSNDKVYTNSSSERYHNHPLIIALDNDHHFLLEHPLTKRLMLRKWKLYQPLFYFPRILAFLLLAVLTFYVLHQPAPVIKSSSSSSEFTSSPRQGNLEIRWTIIIVSSINLLKIIIEILLYRGLRSPFAQLFGIVSFLSSILAFIPYENQTNDILIWQWQLTSFSVSFQWFNAAVILRSVPKFGFYVAMIESILTKFTLLLLSIFPLLIAFTISTKMIFFNHQSFFTILSAMHKSSSMIIGEFDYENLFFSKSTFTAATFIFIPFIVIMNIVFMNLLLGITVGDIKSSEEKARAKANAYWIRELIYIESTLPSKTWLKYNINKPDRTEYYLRDLMQKKMKKENENKDDTSINQPYRNELEKLLDILDMLCTQAKQVLEYEIDLEKMIKRLLEIRKARHSIGSISDRFLTVK